MSQKTCFQAISIAVQLGNVQWAYGESAFEELYEILYIKFWLDINTLYEYTFDI